MKRKKKTEEAETEGPKMIKCPGCDLMLPVDDHQAQIAHMNKFHPEIIKERLGRL